MDAVEEHGAVTRVRVRRLAFLIVEYVLDNVLAVFSGARDVAGEAASGLEREFGDLDLGANTRREYVEQMVIHSLKRLAPLAGLLILELNLKRSWTLSSACRAR